MPYSKEEIVAAVTIAERAVIRDRKRSRFLETETPPCIVDKSRELQGYSMEEILDNPLAEKLLPQARIIVAQREARNSALEDTMLGRMKLALDRITPCLAGGVKDPLSICSAPFADDKLGASGNQAWRTLLEAVGKRNKGNILNALGDLLSSAQADLVVTELPEVESDYRFPIKHL